MHRCDYLAFILIYASMAIVLAWPYLAGGMAMVFNDVGIDTFAQFFPLNIEHARQMASGEGVTWSFNLGLGAYTGSHFDPFWWLQALFPSEWQLSLRIHVYLLKLGLAGLMMVAYLRLIGVRGWPAVLGGLGYAFSDYALINGQWDLHGTELLHFIVLAYLLERYLRTSQLWLALGIGLLLGAGHPFNLFTSAFFTALYVLARTAVLGDWRSWQRILMALFGLAVMVCVGILILAPLNFPGLFYFLESPRVSGNHANLAHVLAMIFQLNDLSIIASSLLGFLGKNSMGVGSVYTGWTNWLEGPGFYVGLPLLLMTMQLIGPKSSPMARRLFWIAAVGLALYVLVPGFRYAVYGFNHVVFRTSTLWLSMLLVVLGALGFRQILRVGMNKPLMVTSLVLVSLLVVVALASMKVALNQRHLILVSGLLVVYAVTFLVARPEYVQRVALAIVAVFLVEIVLLSRPSLVDRAAVAKTAPIIVGTYADGSHEAAQWIAQRQPQGSVYRVEKDYTSMFLMDSIIQGYRGIRSYYFHAAALTRFIDKLGWPRGSAPHSNYIDADMKRADILDLLGVRYILAKTRDRDSDPRSRHRATVAGIEIYERPGALGFARLHSRVVGENDIAAMPLAQRDRLMVDAVLMEDPADVSTQMADNPDALPADVDIVQVSDVWLRGTYSAPGVRLLALSMPFDRGWQFWLDGDKQPTPLFPVNYGLAGAVVPAGDHRFELRYRPPGRVLGYWVAPLGIALAGLLLFAQHRWRTSARSARPVIA